MNQITLKHYATAQKNGKRPHTSRQIVSDIGPENQCLVRKDFLTFSH